MSTSIHKSSYVFFLAEHTLVTHGENSFGLQGVAIDPFSNFLFAAGQDNHIRAWSLRTGQPLCPPTTSAMEVNFPHNGHQCNPLTASYKKNIVSMQVTNEREGVCLWVASHENLDKYWIGQTG
jgi:WD repeat-containing protein 21A